MLKRVYLPALWVVLIILYGCSAQQAAKKDEGLALGRYPKVVAVLPFTNATVEPGVADQVRRSFYNHFSSKPYRDIEVSVVDEKIAKLEKSTGKTVFELPPKEVAEAVGADGLLYGKVTDFKKVFAVAYSQIGAEAEVWMVDAKTGKELLRVKQDARFHEGGVPLSPVGAVMTLVSTAMNLRDIQQIRVINELGWKLNEKIPSPEGMKAEQKPLIKNVLSNAKEGPFGKGKTIKAAMEGEEGLIALFEIGGIKKAASMKEASNGEYIGEYTVMPGDDVKDSSLIAYLRRPSGEESEWHDISGFFTIDTTPPPPVAELKGRAFPDRIELSWKGVDAPDLKGYKVLRGKKPISEYEDAGFTEEARFADQKAGQKEVYYYRVEAIDAAGNVSARSEPVKLVLKGRDIITLEGRISKDTTLYSGAYLVKGGLIVDSGVTLTIEPDTKIYFSKDASLNVPGSIVAEGTEDGWVEFLPESPEVKWAGINIEGGHGRLKKIRVSGAEKAVSIKNSGTNISDSIIEYNAVGVIAEGMPSPDITGTTVWRNNEGVRIDSSRPSLSGNEITQNSTGVVITNSTPEVSGNNIHANALNASSVGSSPQLDRNYLGSVNIDEMRLKGGFSISKVLDSPYPEGILTDAVSNPYANLSPQERKDRLTELLIKSGKYFRERNFGKSATGFEESLKIDESPTAY
ncbi:MAG: DUF799 family lipoprotein, partial [Deltaproteobacteria bacterium]|nr:DUF799 family lipoprotein [Deltaproteobacteria bacterium]